MNTVKSKFINETATIEEKKKRLSEASLKYISGIGYTNIREDFKNLINDDFKYQEPLLPFTIIAISAGDFDTANQIIPKITNKASIKLANRLLDHQQAHDGMITRSSSLFSSLKLPSTALLYEAIERQDWVKLYTLSWLLCNVIGESAPESKLDKGNAREFLGYAMIKLNLRFDLSILTRNTKEDYKNFNHFAICCYSDYFDKRLDEVIEIGDKYLPSKLNINDDPFYSLMFEFYADSLLKKNRKHDLIFLLEKEKELNGENSWWKLYSGLIDYETDLDSAVKKWEAAAYSNSFCLGSGLIAKRAL